MMHDEMPCTPAPALPVLLIVDSDPMARSAIEATLLRRFGSDYQVMTVGAAKAGIAALTDLAERGEAIALVAVDLNLPGMDGISFLAQARALHSQAMRALLVPMDRRGTRIPFAALEPLRRATALGRIDFWLVKGWAAPEELLYPQVQEALSAWTRAVCPRHAVVRVVGEQWSPQSHELRDLLGRNTIPFEFHSVDSPEGERLLDTYEVDAERLPAAILHDGAVLYQPTARNIADALGVHAMPSAQPYDLAILGAGPAGMAAAVCGASEGLETLVVEPRAIGGQAGTSAMIRNYLGFPRGVSGGELAFRAWEQALLLGAQFIFQRRASGLEADGRERIVRLSDASDLRARAVIIAAGVEYRRLGVPSLERLVGAGVFYGAAGVEAPAIAGEEVFVIGGANSAGQAALHLARFAAHVTLLVRGESLAASMSEYLITQIEATPNVQVRLRTRVVDGSGESQLETITVEDGETGQYQELPAAALFVMIGAEPRTEWLREVIQCDERGYILTGHDVPLEAWPLQREPLPYETSVPGIFAVGDARHGSVKRVAGAVGEGSVAVGSAHIYLATIEREAAVA